MQSRTRPNRVVKPSAPRRPNRRLDDLAAQFGGHGNTGDASSHGLYQPTANNAAADDDHDGAGGVATTTADDEVVMGDYKGELEEEDEGEGDADADQEPDHGHVVDMDHHSMAPMAPMSPNHHHHQHHHHQNIDDLTAPELLHSAGLHYAAAADLQSPSSPPPPVGNTMPAPQPLVAATDFQPNPPPPQSQPPPPSPFQATPPPPPNPNPLPPQQQSQPVLQHQHQHQQQQHHVLHHHHQQHDPRHQSPAEPHHHPLPQQQQQQQHKTTEQMAQESGYEGFKVDSAFAKRMSRDPGQRLAEQRREGQELNLVRRSNVEALFAQIAGTEAANSCTHCKKGQGPWTVCVVYSGQMMGSCANCWFNASGSRCSFHEKSQPQPVATHPYAVPVPLPGPSGGAAAVNDPSSVGGHVVNAFAAAGAAAAPSPAQLQAAALWNASGAMFSHDAGVKGTVQSALLQVREATPYQRALIQVEVAAKQLALKIVEAEELAVGLGHGGEGQDGDGGGGAGALAGVVDGEEVHQGQQNHHEYDSPPGDGS